MTIDYDVTLRMQRDPAFHFFVFHSLSRFFQQDWGESELWAENNQSPENALAVYRDNAFHCIWIDAKNGEIRIMFEETEEQLSQKCAANHKKQMFNEDMRKILIMTKDFSFLIFYRVFVMFSFEDSRRTNASRSCPWRAGISGSTGRGCICI